MQFINVVISNFLLLLLDEFFQSELFVLNICWDFK